MCFLVEQPIIRLGVGQWRALNGQYWRGFTWSVQNSLCCSQRPSCLVGQPESDLRRVCMKQREGQLLQSHRFALERGTEPRLPRCLSARPRVLASLGLYPDVPLVTSDRACSFHKGTEPISRGAEWQTKAARLQHRRLASSALRLTAHRTLILRRRTAQPAL